ncbi:MAG: sodium:solute symporter [Verrucomicrobia bacterium]|nr:sodium:solute symporter [Verrucomicrobiota bacterium]
MGRKEESMHDFALGGRKIPWWAVLASIIAAETSAGTFIGTPGEGYSTRGFLYVQLAIGTVLARVVIAYIFIKPYYDYNVYSIYEFLTRRFGVVSKNAASGVFLITRVLASGTRLYVAAIILVLSYELFTGARPDKSGEFWIYAAASTLIVVLTAIYTTLGGIKAVIWTDVIQATIMMGSALVAAGILYHGAGGWAVISAKLNGPNDLQVFSSGLIPGADFWTNVKSILEKPYNLWAAILGSTFVTMATHGTDQDMVQRMLTAENVKRSRMSLILSGLADIPVVLIFLVIGILLWVFYQVNPDPNLPKKTNEIFGHFILTGLPVGMRGLLVAGIFATAMGSLSTALNALATSYTRDFHEPYLMKRQDEAASMRAVRWATVVFSILMIVVSAATAYFVILKPDSRIIPIALGIFGYTYGSLLGVFLVGMLTRTRGNDTGNLIAMVCGFVFVAWLSGLPNDIGRMLGTEFYQQPAWLPVIAFPWRILFGTLMTFAIACLFRTPQAVVDQLPEPSR